MSDGSTFVPYRPWSLARVTWDEVTNAHAVEPNIARTYKLYRLFGGERELLYIGITSLVRPLDRIQHHANHKHWFRPMVRFLTMEDTGKKERRQAEAVEKVAIGSELPVFNWQGNSPERVSALWGEFVARLEFERNGRVPEHLRGFT